MLLSSLVTDDVGVAHVEADLAPPDEAGLAAAHAPPVSYVLHQLDAATRRLLYVGAGRRAKSLLRFFHDRGKVWCRELEFVCSDMWRPYLKVIARKAPQALHILDR